MLSMWIVPYSWSHFRREGYLQPFFLKGNNGKPLLVRCDLLNADLQQVGSWMRATMPIELVQDIEARVVKECPYFKPTATVVPEPAPQRKKGR